MARWMIPRCSRARSLRLGSCSSSDSRVERHRRDRVVDVVRDAARHLAERAQPLLLHHRLLRLAQVVVGPLQRVVELRLVGGQRDVLAELPQEFAVVAAEGLGARAARRRSTPNTSLSTISGATTSERRPALGKARRERELESSRCRARRPARRARSARGRSRRPRCAPVRRRRFPASVALLPLEPLRIADRDRRLRRAATPTTSWPASCGRWSTRTWPTWPRPSSRRLPSI